MEAETAVDEAAFAAAMTAFAPFEPEPVVAVAVSGGPDSMALVLLADAWARARGGSVVAFTVDHGLRPESGAEARQVGAWLAARAIDHAVLEWTGDKPHSAIQATARASRYRLLVEACAARGILHLAFAHHADDQAETVLFRQERGSGADGLAGMPALRSLGRVRLLRPLLAWRKQALVATCRTFGQCFADDPSNCADRFARTGLRRRLAADLALGRHLLDEQVSAEPARQDRARRLARVMGQVAEIRPDGAILLDAALFRGLSDSDRCAVLVAALRTAGGSSFAAAADAVQRLDARLRAESFRGASLGGCAVRPWRDRVLICREAGRTAPPVPLPAGEWRRWDDRFDVHLASGAPAGTTLGALGRLDYARLKKLGATILPSALGAALPAVRVGDRVVAVPPLGWSEAGAPAAALGFSPLWPLSAETITVVNR